MNKKNKKKNKKTRVTTHQSKLYHFTSTAHLPLIFKSGYLKLTESNLTAPSNYFDSLPKPEHLLYKPVVWLTTSKDGNKLGIEGSVVDKKEVRITLNKKKHYISWKKWSKQNKIKSSWANWLNRSGNSDEWYISEKIIEINAENILRIENAYTGEIYL